MLPMFLFMDIPFESEIEISDQGVVVMLKGECWFDNFLSKVTEVHSHPTSFFGHPLI